MGVCREGRGSGAVGVVGVVWRVFNGCCGFWRLTFGSANLSEVITGLMIGWPWRAVVGGLCGRRICTISSRIINIGDGERGLLYMNCLRGFILVCSLTEAFEVTSLSNYIISTCSGWRHVLE